MDQNDIQRNAGRRTSRMWSGLILLISGVLLLAYKIGAPIPYWVFSWPVLLILIGFLTGIKSSFHNAGSFVMIIIGSVFLVDKIVPELDFHNYIFPALLIGIGLIFILRPKYIWGNEARRDIKWRESKWRNTYSNNEESPASLSNQETIAGGSEGNSEYIEINAVLGGVKKLVLSKNFKGGEINSFMGGTELNLMQADILQPVVLEVHNIFGGTKLIVPANWDVKNEVTAIFGGIDDKRNLNTGVPDAGKTMILKGTCIFGGIEVSNY